MAEWRQKARDGTLTQEDQREAVAAIRQGRKSAAITSEQARRTKAKSVVKSADELLGELGAL